MNNTTCQVDSTPPIIERTAVHLTGYTYKQSYFSYLNTTTTMKRSTARNMSFAVLMLMMTAMSCNKNETPKTEATDKEPEQTPVTMPVEEETAAAAAARVASPVPG